MGSLVGKDAKKVTSQWRFVTGIIAAVLGAETPTGEFEVVDVCFAGLPVQLPRSVTAGKGKGVNGSASSGGSWVALASGLELGGNEQADDLKADLLAEWLTGELGDLEVSLSLYCFVTAAEH